jgi:signal transduction histidine kinase
MTAAHPTVDQRAERLFLDHRQRVYRQTDRLFAGLMIAQWVFAIVVALVFSPYAWAGKVKTVNLHVYIAVFLGGAVSSLPVVLAWMRPGAPLTRYVIAVAQMMWSALLIHLTGGRIETHFHVFGSLAFLAFYRDWRVLVPATVVVAADHFIRQQFWPESVFGILNPEWWRFLEHAFWVVYEDIVLIMACLVGVREMHSIARAQAEVEALSESERDKSRALNQALIELKQSQESQVRAEKLAAVGQLAASVSHELRNPIAAVRNANTYVSRRFKDGKDLAGDPKIQQFLGLVDRELDACTKIIGDLLDFARERPLVVAPCPLRALTDEAIEMLPAHQVKIVNEVPIDLPVPSLDKDQIRQILVNLVQNAVEAMPQQVKVRADGGGDRAWQIMVQDDGPGIPAEVATKIFEPLFTTKTKGTGLGLAIVSSVVKRHGGSIRVESAVGKGTTFIVDLPGQGTQSTTEAL